MTNSIKSILVVEDEPTLAQVLCEYIEHAGMSAHHLDNGGGVIDWVKSNKPSLMVLDLMLPVRDGLDIYRELRTFSDVPVIMATAKVDEIDRLLGLELGADDYVCKPYSPREVIARIKNVLRRTRSSSSESQKTEVLVVEDDTMRVLLHGKEVSLTPAEFRLLSYLFRHEGRIFSREQLMDKIYSDGRVVTDRTIDSHIKNLRKKMEEVDPRSDFIKSIYSVGYKFEF